MGDQKKGRGKAWHALETGEVLAHFVSDVAQGLDRDEVEHRRNEYGPNELEERGGKSPWRILWDQLKAAMVVILIIAAVVSALLGDTKDAVAILVIVVLNALLGFRQEYKAERAMAALKKLAVPKVKVRREGAVKEVSARDLVPGDIVILEEGGLVPADCRLVDVTNLRIQEAALTGESLPVEKASSTIVGGDVALADRHNMAYMGTVVSYGRGLGVVTGTGMDTELGHIASMIQTVESELTPLQKRLDRLGRWLAVAALILVSIIFSVGLLFGGEVKELFLTAISLAVAAVPEGLPAVVTIALALGSQRMLRRKALIRKLPAVETLGSVTVICTDKTGTLTENRMTVTMLEVAGLQVGLMELVGHASEKQASSEKLSMVLANYPPSVPLLMVGGALCNDAVLKTGDTDEERTFQTVGDPTEGALVTAAAKVGLLKHELEEFLPRTAEVPFDSERKMMTTVHRFGDLESHIAQSTSALFRQWIRERENYPYIVFTKGAVDSLVNVSCGILHGDRIEPFAEAWRNTITAANDAFARKGMRVLGVAYRHLKPDMVDKPDVNPEQDLIFIGMVGMIDPPRPEVRDAVKTSKEAGIRPVMITGDHPLTAGHIADELGIASEKRVLTGEDLVRLSMGEVEGFVEDTSVFARVSPEHKLNIVQALQDRGHIVAMTGDGVNDAPALKRADIGVAMGITGTDVSKEVADMVLLDDNFATIVAAVEEGRVIYDNIRKFIKYLLTTNVGEIWVMLLGPFLGMPLPLLPLQILWINLVTDGFPALALGVEPAEPDVMARPPYHPNESVFSRGVGRHILWVGIVMGLVPLLTGYWYWLNDREIWQTMIFTTLTFTQMAHVLAIRSGTFSLFTIGLLSNKPLLGAVLLTFLLQVAVTYVPFLQGFFRTISLPPVDFVYCIGLSSIIFWAVELEKLHARRTGRRTGRG